MNRRNLFKALLFGLMALPFFGKKAHALKKATAYRVKVNAVVAGVFQTGKTINLCIMRSSDKKRFDFSDNTWKDSDWVSKTVTMTEETDSDSPYYYYDWDYPASNPEELVYTFFAKGSAFNFYDIQDISWEQMNIGMIG